MSYYGRHPWDEPVHRVRWTDEGGFCDAGDDCPECEAERRAEEGLDDEDEDEAE